MRYDICMLHLLLANALNMQLMVPFANNKALTVACVFAVVQLCIAVPCHIFKFWAFIGIMFQVCIACVCKT